MNALDDVNWKWVSWINLLVAFLFFLPYFPIAWYLHDISFEILHVLSIAGFYACIFWLPAVFVGTMIFSASMAYKGQVTAKIRYGTFWTIFYTLPFTFLICFMLLFNGGVPNFGKALMISEGEVIVEALDAYKYDNSFYPKSLEELTPLYLKKIPHSKFPAFSPFLYKPCKDEFELEFRIYYPHFRVRVIHYTGTLNDNTIRGHPLKETGYPLWKYYDNPWR